MATLESNNVGLPSRKRNLEGENEPSFEQVQNETAFQNFSRLPAPYPIRHVTEHYYQYPPSDLTSYPTNSNYSPIYRDHPRAYTHGTPAEWEQGNNLSKLNTLANFAQLEHRDRYPVGKPTPLLEGVLVAQPYKHQVVNYNIHPAPALALTVPLEDSVTFRAYLLETKNGTILSRGFQSGEVRVIPPGAKLIYFTGLKLNKMGPIKIEMQEKKLKHDQDTQYCVQLIAGDQSWFTSPFRLVSSCSQLNVGEKVMRPSKKRTGTIAASDSVLMETSTGLATVARSTPSPIIMPQQEEKERDEDSPPIPQEASVLNQETVKIRLELERAIAEGDPEGASKAAQKLAILVQVKMHSLD